MNLKRKLGINLCDFLKSKCAKYYPKNDVDIFAESYGNLEIDILHVFPLEIILQIFSYLDIYDIYHLCELSKRYTELVKVYLSLKSCRLSNYFVQPHNKLRDTEKIIVQYKQLAILYSKIFENSSFILQLDFLGQHLKRHLCYCSETSCSQFLNCSSMEYFGHFLRIFLRNCSSCQLKRTFQTLIQYCFNNNFWKELTNLVFLGCGIEMKKEVRIRLFLRRLFLDRSVNYERCKTNEYLEEIWSKTDEVESVGQNSDEFVNSEEIIQYRKQLDSGCCREFETSKANKKINLFNIWMSEILKSYKIQHQAKILFILYGPFYKGNLMWQEMRENTAADRNQVLTCFGELGWAIHELKVTCQYRIEHIVLLVANLTERISTIRGIEFSQISDEWLSENTASLLYTTGFEVTNGFMLERMRSKTCLEVAMLVASLCLVQVKLDTDFQHVISLVQNTVQSVSGKKNKANLLSHIAESFKDVLQSLYLSDDIDNRLEDIGIILKAQSQFILALMKRQFA